MAHHTSEVDEVLRKHFAQTVEDYFGLGATGQFPDGKLCKNDEGEIRFAVTTFKGCVVIDFGKAIQSLGMRPEEARAFADLLLMKAGKAEREVCGGEESD